ncbi:MAG: phosphate/phosphite/phosphonate ABC transporter substrate-binding protein [Oscillochloris sp.]|nr:phosphate/phosphite/phosphonate ABC transporter substrate-binding protein [Oscillochloris sp.]
MFTRIRLPLALSSLLIVGLLIAACGAAPTAAPNSAAEAANAPAAADPRAGWPETFRLGLFGGDDAEEVLESNEPLRTYLEAQLGVPVEIFTGTSYTAVIEAMRADRVDAMQVGPFSYILAVQEAQAEAIVVGISTSAEPAVYDPNLQPYYYSAIFTRKGSGVETIEDLRGQDFSFVDPASTSGHLIPKTYLVGKGINPDEEMNTIFAGSHPTSVEAVANGKVAAGAATIATLYRMNREGQVQLCTFPDGGEPNMQRSEEVIRSTYEACPEGSLAVIALSDPIPNTPFAVRQELPDSFKQAVKQALLNIKDQPDLVTIYKRWFVDPTADSAINLDQLYNPLRDVATILDLDLKELAEQ